MRKSDRLMRRFKKGRMEGTAHVNINKLIAMEKEEERKQLFFLAIGIAIIVTILFFFYAVLQIGWSIVPEKTAEAKVAFLIMPALIFGLFTTPIVRKIMKYFYITPFYINRHKRKQLRKRNPRQLRIAQIKRFIVYLAIGTIIWELILFTLI